MRTSSYFFIAVSSVVGLLYFLRAVRIIFNGRILKSKVFEFPDKKYDKAMYCICVALLMLIAVLDRLNMI
jgi:hypothetical protein